MTQVDSALDAVLAQVQTLIARTATLDNQIAEVQVNVTALYAAQEQNDQALTDLRAAVNSLQSAIIAAHD